MIKYEGAVEDFILSFYETGHCDNETEEQLSVEYPTQELGYLE